MTWRKAIQMSPEDTAVMVRGDYSYLKYPNGSVFHAKSGNYKIKEKCYDNPSGEWQPLGLRLGEIPKDF